MAPPMAEQLMTQPTVEVFQ
jgi:hypothetical protein